MYFKSLICKTTKFQKNAKHIQHCEDREVNVKGYNTVI